jgi:ribosomal protein S18 acetylase RimI-like enzyme
VPYPATFALLPTYRDRQGGAVAAVLGVRHGTVCRGWQDYLVEIRWITQSEAVQAAGHLFDAFPQSQATEKFLADERHHLLIAYLDGVAAGMVTGVEMTHPDKGTEMFLYELGVDERFHRRGIGQALVSALTALARERGCYGMWVLTDEDNMAAQATYSRAGGVLERMQVMFAWTFQDS